ncbi:MAG: MopE-related protein [Myxococcota bacterium]
MRWLWTFLLAGCAAEKPDTGGAPVPPWLQDDDGDTFTADQDCDDADAAVHPGAPEVCDGRDQDCDLEIDEDALDAVTRYPDDDGDGAYDRYASPSCDPPPGASEPGTDCDDNDAAVFPGATERCNGVDDDCDGERDEDTELDAVNWYGDADGDGFGDPAATVLACAAPVGSVADATDCDDRAAGTFPGAPERCDGADNDCDGGVDEDPESATTWYADRDGDTYGDAGTAEEACARPEGSTRDATDCDDTDVYTHPGAHEQCGGGDEDCDGTTDESDAADAPTWYPDGDADGYGADTRTSRSCRAPAAHSSTGGDCDDGDATISPAATETCDEVDEDCDGAVDEDAGDATAWYLDGDGDGFGDPATRTETCGAPAGHVADGSDCDDAEADTFPGAIEACDGADDDCDGTVDEADAIDTTAWYVDDDADGYGDAAVATLACDAPAGMVALSGDCDDTSGVVNPGRSETCNDGLDNDCDGGDDGCIRVGATDLETVYQARVVGAVAHDLVGRSIAHVGDVDRDGTPDLALGVYGLDEVWLVHGVPFGELGPFDVHGAFVGAAGEGWGGAVAGVGDTDGDGYDDVLLGAAGAGAACLLPGPWDPVEDERDATLRLEGEGSSSGVGDVFAGAGDLDGDGLTDLVIGAPRADGTYAYGGVAYVVYGGGSGTLDLGTADGAVLGAFTYATLGDAVAGVGDVDGDGLDDLLVGSPGDRTAAVLAGAAYLVLGPASGTREAAAADAIFLGERTYDLAGSAVAGAGDTDGDGALELLVGAEYHDGGGANGGAAYLLRGPFAGTSSLAAAAAGVVGAAAGDLAGSAVAGAGDFDGDGFDDWMVGAWPSDLGGESAGAVFLLYGPGPWSADLGAADLVLRGTPGAQAGFSLSGGAGAWGTGDLTGDGLDDLLVGAPADAAPGPATGAGYLVAGQGL